MSPSPLNSKEKIWIGLLGLVVIFFFAILIEFIGIEKQLTDRVSAALHQQGLQRIDVEVRGRDVQLFGKSGSQYAHGLAGKIAQSIDGVRTVRSNLQIQPVRLPYLEIISGSPGLTLRGELPNSEAIDTVVGFTAAAGFNLEQQAITVEIESGVPQWLICVEELIDFIREIEGFRAEIGAGEVWVGGSVDSDAAYQAVSVRMATWADKCSLRWKNQIATVLP